MVSLSISKEFHFTVFSVVGCFRSAAAQHGNRTTILHGYVSGHLKGVVKVNLGRVHVRGYESRTVLLKYNIHVVLVIRYPIHRIVNYYTRTTAVKYIHNYY